MSLARNYRAWVAFGLAILLLGCAVAYLLNPSNPGDPRLDPFVHSKPPVPIVFTSRSEPASLAFSAPEGEGFTAPGQRLWAAREGRLRLLTPKGTVHELTWNKPLPDGGTLIDVMSPSISLDGKRILFAGRRGGDDHGRFRLYQVAWDGSGLKSLTGGVDDQGCTALPPLRWRAAGTLIPDAERRASDYDDVDPIELNFTDRRIAFVSSRTPDLGRDHARRSTTLWVLHADGNKQPASANRNNDRWPFLLSSGYIAFSLWSRNREVVTADLSNVHPYEPGTASATKPTDAWLGAFTQMPGGHFGMLIKPAVPVWRPRPLFANRITFTTSFADAREHDAEPPLTVVQAPPGLLAHAPSASVAAHPLPRTPSDFLRRGPDRDREGRPLWLATPSPCPPEHLLLAGATLREGAKKPAPGDYALYLAHQDWPEGSEPASASAVDLKLLFDDPELVDAEPVAVYERKFVLHDPAKLIVGQGTGPAELRLTSGEQYRGPMGMVFATGLDAPTQLGDLPGQMSDTGEAPIFDSPPAGTLDHLRIYAARRDRFDDPTIPRTRGSWELILKYPVKNGAAASWVPSDVPTVLAGFDKDGHVVQWTTAAKDRQGRRASVYAYAGDHYSLAQPNGKHFCVGCHPGHSGMTTEAHRHAEQSK
ncbi:MAG: hypothetical protein EXS09_08255 [Gemmataceae bacterium]|nr:hypothetical protein [Gemmataceae bacterium]